MVVCNCQGVAQFGSALPWGGRGRGFESRRPDHPTSLKLRGAESPEGLDRSGSAPRKFTEVGQDMHYVYILKLTNGQYYIGETSNVTNRVRQHFQNNTKTTTRIKPERLVFYAAFEKKEKAVLFEKYLKSSSGFAFRNKRLI